MGRHAGSLDKYRVEGVSGEEDKRLYEAGGQAAAKKLPVVELRKLDAVVGDETTVDIDPSPLVDDDAYLFSLPGCGVKKTVQQCSLARAQKSGDDVKRDRPRGGHQSTSSISRIKSSR